MNCEHKGEVLKYADGSQRCLDCEKMIKPDYKTQIKAQAATIAQLRELVKLAEEFHTDVMVATAVRGKEPNFTTANETWLKFYRAARALKGGE